MKLINTSHLSLGWYYFKKTPTEHTPFNLKNTMKYTFIRGSHRLLTPLKKTTRFSRALEVSVEHFFHLKQNICFP